MIIKLKDKKDCHINVNSVVYVYKDNSNYNKETERQEGKQKVIIRERIQNWETTFGLGAGSWLHVQYECPERQDEDIERVVSSANTPIRHDESVACI